MKPLFSPFKPATPVLWVGMVLVLLGLAPAVGHADVILGNLFAGDGGNVMIDSSDYAAASFTMGSQAYVLSDVQIRLRGGVPDGITFQLRSDAGGQPSNSPLLTFVNPAITGLAVETDTFSAGSLFVLTANSTYWLVGFTTSSSARWVDSSPHVDPLGSGATFGQYKESSNSGLIWLPTTDAPKFQVDGTPVGAPEPSSLVLVGMVACVAGVVGLRRRHTQRHGEQLASVVIHP